MIELDRSLPDLGNLYEGIDLALFPQRDTIPQNLRASYRCLGVRFRQTPGLAGNCRLVGGTCDMRLVGAF